MWKIFKSEIDYKFMYRLVRDENERLTQQLNESLEMNKKLVEMMEAHNGNCKIHGSVQTE